MVRLPSAKKWLAISPGIIILFVGMYVVRMGVNVSDEKPGDKTAQMINNIIRSETSGGFESWRRGDFSFPNERPSSFYIPVIYKGAVIQVL
jgi:hypothetical protein